MKRPRPAKPAPVIDPREMRWRYNRLVPADMPTAAPVSVATTPLDAYRHAGAISDEQYDAGDRLRVLWTEAGRDASVTSSLEPYVSGGEHDEISDQASEAWGKFRRITLRLAKDHFLCVYAVCLVGEPVEKWAASRGAPGQLGILFLKDALDALGEAMRRAGRRE